MLRGRYRMNAPKNGKEVNENGTIRYYKDGKLHREDGPAVIWTNGDKWYYLNGKQMTKEQYTTYVIGVMSGVYQGELE